MVGIVLVAVGCLFSACLGGWAMGETPQQSLGETRVTNVRNAQHTLDEIVANQPRLNVDPEDEQRNGAPLAVRYRINESDDALYYTYVYVWTFSDTPWYFEWLGYPDHEWDYEPIIVRIDRETGRATYIYDRGHYRAGTSETGTFDVMTGTHYFTPSTGPEGRTLPKGSFLALTDDELQLMNAEAAKIPRLPFGQPLSLDWAYNDPEKVALEGAFSTYNGSSALPVQVHALGGVIIGIMVGIAIRALSTFTSQKVSWRIAAIAGTISGLVAGLAGGLISAAIQESFDSTMAGAAAGIFAGGMSGSVTLAAIRKSLYAAGWRRAAVLGGLCGTVAALLTSIW